MFVYFHFHDYFFSVLNPLLKALQHRQNIYCFPPLFYKAMAACKACRKFKMFLIVQCFSVHYHAVVSYHTCPFARPSRTREASQTALSYKGPKDPEFNSY